MTLFFSENDELLMEAIAERTNLSLREVKKITIDAYTDEKDRFENFNPQEIKSFLTSLCIKKSKGI